MLFTCETVEAVARLVDERNWERVESLRPDGFTLSAAIELACRDIAWAQAGIIEASRVVKRWALDQPILAGARGAFSCNRRLAEGADAKFMRLPNKESVADVDFENFLRRFRQGLRESGFSAPLSYGLAGAMEAMVDNLGQHSFDPRHASGGVVAYRLRRAGMTFAVADVGRGALASLKDNPDWASLSSEFDALNAIVHKGASRRIGLGPGEGFKSLFKALASFNGELRLRSGPATFSIQGNLDQSRGLGGFCPEVPGMQVSVLCRAS